MRPYVSAILTPAIISSRPSRSFDTTIIGGVDFTKPAKLVIHPRPELGIRQVPDNVNVVASYLTRQTVGGTYGACGC